MEGRTFEQIDAELTAAEAAGNTSQRKALADELIDRARAFTESDDADKALKCCQRALSVYQDLSDIYSIAIARSTMGIAYKIAGDYPRALEHQTYALDAAIASGNEERIAATTHNIGMVYEHTGELPRALEFFQRAVDINERRGDLFWQGHNVIGMAMAHHHAGDLPRSLELFKQGLALYRITSDPRSIAQALTNVGVTLMLMQDPDEAIPYYEEALQIERQHGIRALEVNTLIALGGAHVKQGRIKDARSTYSLVEHEHIEDPKFRIARASLAANILIQEGDLEGAHAHFVRGLEIAELHGLPAYISETHKELRDLARLRGDLDGYVRHNDAFNQTNEITKGRETTTRLAMQAKQREIETMERERERERAVLYSTLPKDIADRVVRGEKITGDEYEHAAVLFVDVVSFTTHTSTMHPGDVVTLIENIFHSLDEACAQHGVVKIKTIGDSYMCFRGDGTAAENVGSIAAVALDAMRSAHTWPSGAPVQFRAGAHAGPVTAGVIGTQRLQYDIWGDTVNVASRMESHGEAGRIHVSEAFATVLRSVDGGQWTVDDPSPHPPVALSLHQRGTIEIKGKGPMTTYWLEGA